MSIYDVFSGGSKLFDKAESIHIHRVLRLEPGEKILVCDGSGMDYSCVLETCAEVCTARIEQCFKNEKEPKTELVLFQYVLKNEKMDMVIQKAAELGANRIVPVLTRLLGLCPTPRPLF